MHKLFEFFEKEGLSNEFDEILKWENKKIVKFIEDIRELNLNEKQKSNKLFSYSTNESLSSGISPCTSLGCRYKKINELIQFAILYSDEVFIYNPFEKYYRFLELKNKTKRLKEDLMILRKLQPLLEKGILKFSYGKQFICPECSKKFREKYIQLEITIEKLIYDTTKFEVKDLKNTGIEISGYQEILGHDKVYLGIKDKFQDIYLEYEKNGGILERKDIEPLGIVQDRTKDIMYDLIRQNSNVSIYGNKFLFDNFMYPSLLGYKSNEKENCITTNKFTDALKFNLPIIENTSVKDLIKLRENEYEAFLVYRDALRRLIKETYENGGYGKNLKEAISDIVIPEINRMNNTIKNNKRLLSYENKKDIFVGAGLLGLGLMSGILPKDFGEVVGAIGGCNFIKVIIDKILEMDHPEFKVNDNEYFFVWKILNQ